MFPALDEKMLPRKGKHFGFSNRLFCRAVDIFHIFDSQYLKLADGARIHKAAFLCQLFDFLFCKVLASQFVNACRHTDMTEEALHCSDAF